MEFIFAHIPEDTPRGMNTTKHTKSELPTSKVMGNYSFQLSYENDLNSNFKRDVTQCNLDQKYKKQYKSINFARLHRMSLTLVLEPDSGSYILYYVASMLDTSRIYPLHLYKRG